MAGGGAKPPRCARRRPCGSRSRCAPERRSPSAATGLAARPDRAARLSERGATATPLHRRALRPRRPGPPDRYAPTRDMPRSVAKPPRTVNFGPPLRLVAGASSDTCSLAGTILGPTHRQSLPLTRRRFDLFRVSRPATTYQHSLVPGPQHQGIGHQGAYVRSWIGPGVARQGAGQHPSNSSGLEASLEPRSGKRQTAARVCSSERGRVQGGKHIRGPPRSPERVIEVRLSALYEARGRSKPRS